MIMSTNLRQHQGLTCLLVLLCGLNAALCFTDDPKNQTIPLGRMAFFSCLPSFDAEDVEWIVIFLNEDIRMSTYAEKPILEMRGFGFGFNVTHAFVNVSASETNNRTLIQCHEFDFESPARFSKQASLIIQGPPQSPGVSVLTPSAVEILLEWGKPFTWPDYDILQYNITEIDSDTELVRMFNTTHLNHSYLSPSGKIATTCKAVTFMVSAVSDLGSSLPAIIKTGLPISPADVALKLEILVRFRRNGDPELTVTIQPPAVCEYQRAHLTLEVMQEDSNESVLVTSHVYFGASSSLTFHVLMQLITNTNYSLTATLTTITRSFSKTKEFDTVLIQPSDNKGVLGPLIGGIVGGLMLIVVLVVVLLVMIFRVRIAKANLREAACAIREQEGDCTYECIDDYQIVATSTCKNQYQKNMPHSSSLPARSESPYQPMKAAETESSTNMNKLSAFHDPLAPPHYITTPCTMLPLQLEPNNNIHLTPGTGPGQFYRESVGLGSEDSYIAMGEAEEPISQKERAHLSLVLSDTAMPYEGQVNGEYRLSIC